MNPEEQEGGLEGQENEQNEEVSKINQFKEFCAIEEEAIARNCLERCEWNVELAVQEYLNEKEGRPSVFGREGEENAQNRAAEEEMELRRRRPPVSYAGLVSRGGVRRVGVGVRRQPGWMEWIVGLVFLPFRFARSVFTDVVSFIWNVLFRGPAAVTDPVGDVRGFVEEFEEKFGGLHPEFFVGSYSMALDRAKKDLRFLLVYLHSPDHQDTSAFCTQTLADPNVVQFIGQNMLFWACSVRTPEGRHVSTALRESTYPFLALICLRDNRMAMVLRQEGFCTSEELVGILGGSIEDNQTFLNLARQEREQRQMDALLREQQEVAFQESLKKDQEREERRRQEEAERERVELERLEEERKKEELKQELDEIKKEIRAKFAEAPENSSSDAVRVSVKFPSGDRIERRFLSSDSLEELFKFCLIQENCPEDFSLVTNFPRKILPCRPSWMDRFLPSGADSASSLSSADIPTFEGAELTNSVMVFVQDNDA